MYAACVSEIDGVRLLTDQQVEAAIEPQTEGTDAVLMDLELRYGLGFMLPSPIMPLGNDRNFGHFGAGGSMGMADPDHDLGFGYVMNKMFLGLTGDPRTTNLIDAVYGCLG
jgi:CubicO group peptidase (beta-lactamase class C family)